MTERPAENRAHPVVFFAPILLEDGSASYKTFSTFEEAAAACHDFEYAFEEKYKSTLIMH